jgi:hypothetical protein
MAAVAAVMLHQEQLIPLLQLQYLRRRLLLGRQRLAVAARLLLLGRLAGLRKVACSD